MTTSSYTVGLWSELSQNFTRSLGKHTMFAKDNLRTDVCLPHTLYFIAYYSHVLFINSFINELIDLTILYFVPSTILGLPAVKRIDTFPSLIELNFLL